MSGEIILEALPLPVLILGSENEILYGNPAAEVFFDIGLRMLQRQRLSDRVPFASPVFALVAEVRRRQASVSEYRVDIGSPRIGMDRIVDAFAAPMQDAGHALLMLHERRIADKMDRQLTHRSAARSITALGAMLAHEIKNPLAGIRGAAQLLEQNAGDEDRLLTQLICDEADRIVMLVERVELFGEERPEEREPVNVHGIIDQVKRSAQSGFARHIRFVERYDPSLPPVFGHRDQLTQTLLNLVKNAAEAIGPDANEGEILLSTAYKTGISVQSPGTFERISLPIELCVQDNGGGVPLNIGADLFDPFVTTKIQGTGLGLALVAKVVGDHGGIVEYESGPRRTVFRVLLPMYHAPNGRAA